MITKTPLGKLENFELGCYFVPHRTSGTGKYRILKHEAWYITNACIIIGNNFWETIPPFDSFVQAVRFLKENYKDLL